MAENYQNQYRKSRYLSDPKWRDHLKSAARERAREVRGSADAMFNQRPTPIVVDPAEFSTPVELVDGTEVRGLSFEAFANCMGISPHSLRTWVAHGKVRQPRKAADGSRVYTEQYASAVAEILKDHFSVFVSLGSKHTETLNKLHSIGDI